MRALFLLMLLVLTGCHQSSSLGTFTIEAVPLAPGEPLTDRPDPPVKLQCVSEPTEECAEVRKFIEEEL